MLVFRTRSVLHMTIPGAMLYAPEGVSACPPVPVALHGDPG